MEATIWALLPPVIAIVLALLTKEVYISLLIGILTGGLLYTGFHPVRAVTECIVIMSEAFGDNMYLILFLILLGMIVYLINISGASRAYGAWAVKKMKSEKSAMFATMFLGALIFIDDYFNCLAVGTIMRPVTDKFKISRVKLAFIIDATAAPICIIAPISSWAAAVGSSLPADSGLDGFALFIQTIPYNFYALLMLGFLIFMIMSGSEFGTMKQYHNSWRGNYEEHSDEMQSSPLPGRGRIKDLLLPVVVLVILCTFFILYTGGILEGNGIVQLFIECDSSLGLALGGFFTLVFMAVLYLPRKVITFKQFCESFLEGSKAMTGAILILSFAWTLSGICGSDYLNIGGYVSGIVSESMWLVGLIPAIMFLVGAGLSFSSGTSWGTFAILIPIAVAIAGPEDASQLAFVIAAILAGAVYGDHISPISDTTILSSTGAGCDHIQHVSTQIPYATVVASGSLLGYLLGGVTGYYFSGLFIGAAVVAVVVLIILKREDRLQGRAVS